LIARWLAKLVLSPAVSAQSKLSSGKKRHQAATLAIVKHTVISPIGKPGKDAMLTRIGRVANSEGFTLIELMIAVVIIAVLMTIALPAYQQQSMLAARAAAQAQMLEVANLQQQYLLANRKYMDAAALAAAGYTPDPVVARHYASRLTVGAGAIPTYQLRLTPFGAQGGDGWLQVDGQGNYSAQYNGRWWR
jgi:type IV pilus assembly protein PilE